MTGFVGGCLAVVGVLKGFEVLDKGYEYLKNDIRLMGPNDTKYKQIGRIVANAMRVIGLFCAAIGMITMGATMYSLAPGLPFLSAMGQAGAASLPLLLGALGALTSGLIIGQLSAH